MATRVIHPPIAVRDAARKALASKPAEVPEVTYRLASGIALFDDVESIALWGLDNAEQFNGSRCTVTAALRGGNAGLQWAMAAAMNDGRSMLVRDQLVASSRTDQQLTAAVATAIAVAWDRQLDHAARKARSRIGRSTEGRGVDFLGWPNARAAQIAGLDDLMDRAWDAFVGSVTAIFQDYARTQASIVAAVDALGAESVRRAIMARVPNIVNALTGFLEQRARDYMTGEVVYAPQDFAAARTVSAWVAGSGGEPTSFAFRDLSEGVFAVALTTAQEAILAASADPIERFFTWIHSFYGAPLRPFIPHEELDGTVLSSGDVQLLTLFPSDHVGCRCELLPDWSY